MEVYRDPEEEGRCPDHPRPRVPDRCVGPNPFPDALQMVQQAADQPDIAPKTGLRPPPECDGYDCLSDDGIKHAKGSFSLVMVVIVVFITMM